MIIIMHKVYISSPKATRHSNLFAFLHGLNHGL